MNRAIWAVLCILLLPSFADVERYVDTSQWVGCDSTILGSSVYPQFQCTSPTLTDVSCSGGVCTGTCYDVLSEECRQTECFDYEYYDGSCGTYLEFATFSGRQILFDMSNWCPYGNWVMESLAADFECTGTDILGWCIGGSWFTHVTFQCESAYCLQTETSIKTCTQELLEVEEVYEVSSGGLCNPGEMRCVGLKRVECSSNGEWAETGAQCAELCCDINNANTNVYCKRRDDIRDDRAICVNTADSDDYAECEPDNSYRCDGQVAQRCENGEWADYEVCKFPCNSTAASLNDTANICSTYNTPVGGCTDFDTFCMVVGPDAFLFTCLIEDWVLTKACYSGRCNENATACYEGCELYSEYCYGTNNSCYYCNKEGDWVYDGVCQVEVNNITGECLSDLACREDATRCLADWVILCDEGSWTRHEQCSFGCLNGKCAEEDKGIFEPLMLISDWFVNIVPTISVFVVTMSMLSIAIYILYKVSKWALG